jgi:hypothetical protein
MATVPGTSSIFLSAASSAASPLSVNGTTSLARRNTEVHPPPIAASHWNGAVQQVSFRAVYAQDRQAPLPV